MSAQESAIQTVPELLARRIAETPDITAFQQEGADGQWGPVSWRTFAERVASVRRGLLAAGLSKGDRLALIAPVSLEWELLHHAALSIGAVVVGLDAHDLPERLARMAEQADIAAFATSDARTLSALGPERIAGAHFVLLLEAGADQVVPGSRCLRWPELAANESAHEAGATAPSAADLATIIFTSGTTGAPKGIAYTHGQVCLAVNATCDAFGFIGPGSRLLCWLPLSNLFQRIVNLAAIRQGATTYLLGDPRRVMQVVAGVSPDIFIGVPRFYEKLYDGIRANIAVQPALRRWLARWAWGIGRRVSRLRLGARPVPVALMLAHWFANRHVLRRVRSVMGQRLRCMVTGSAPTPRHLLEEFHALGWLMLEAYGLSENVLPMAMNRIGDVRFGAVGRPVPGNEIRVADGGSIAVRGPGMFRGYLGEENSAAFDVDGYYRTGDFGRLDADGYLWLTGRAGDLIKTSTGRRVAPVGVEAELRSVPGIDQAVLIGAGRKCLVALCTCTQANMGADARSRLIEILAERIERLAEGERPLAVGLLERPFSVELGELTPNLKLRRSAIEERHADLIRSLYESIERASGPASCRTIVI